MKIKIESIDRENLLFVDVKEQTLGYWGAFSSPMISGAAILVPYTDPEDNLVAGNSISVETSQESVSDFKIVSSDIKPQMLELATPGDYDVVGEVILNSDDQVFDIDVNDFHFALDDEETNGTIPQKGQHVSFKIHKLSLWDEGH